MKNKNVYLLIISIILIISYVFIPEEKVVLKKEVSTKKEEISIRILNDDNSIIKVNLEEYIIGVVAAEMPASFHIEALKAQAIASRTYAMYKIENSSNDYDVTTDVTTQAFITIQQMKEKWQEDFDYYYNQIKNAVNDTNNLVLKQDKEIICAYYFSMSNGFTEESELVFKEDLSYVGSVDSSWDTLLKNFEYTTNITKDKFCNALEINCDEIVINNIIKSDSNRVNYIEINNKTFKGTEVRNLLGLRSTDFNIEIAENISITTKGYGHGVGMSQYGANEMAKQNNSYINILNHYYQNVEINEI